MDSSAFLSSSGILCANVFVRGDATFDEKLAAVNLCAWLGFEAVGFNSDIIKTYDKRAINQSGFFVNCGPYSENKGISVSNAGGKKSITLCSDNTSSLILELFSDNQINYTPPTAEVRTGFDLSNFLTVDGLFIDADKDFIPDFIDCKVVLDEASEFEVLKATGDIAAKLSSLSAGLSLPLCVKEHDGNTVRVTKGACMSVSHGNNAARFEIGLDSITYFLEKMQNADFEDELPEIKDYISNGLNGSGFIGQIVSLLDENVSKAEALLDETDEDIEQLTTFLRSKGKEISLGSYKDDKTVFVMEEDFPWECDTAEQHVRDFVLPKLKIGDHCSLLVSVSEEAEIRHDLKSRLLAMLEKTGATAEVTVISAFKQGLSYIEEKLIPFLKSHKTDKVIIGFKPFQKSEDEPWDEVSGAMPIYASYSEDKKWFDLPIRWLQELYPIDDIIESETGLPKDRIIFEKLPFCSEATYTIRAFDADGNIIFDDAYFARFYERDYLSEYPNSGAVHPQSTFVYAKIGDETICDATLSTDIDMLWNMFQEKVLPSVRDYILKTSTLSKGSQPFFKCLRFDIFASEPDYSLGIREDRISSLDCLHEDLYFTALDYFRVFGTKEIGEAFTEPGLILPFIEKRNGKGLSVKVTLTAFAQKAPAYINDGLNFFETKDYNTSVTGMTINDKQELQTIELETNASINRIHILKDLLESGPICFKPLELIVKNGAESISIKLKAKKPQPSTYDMSTLDSKRSNVISYEEYIELTKHYADEVHIYKAATSFQNRKIYAYEFTEKFDAKFVSRLKLTTHKPTIYINNRHHANEVSSTNSAYALIEKLLHDETTRDYLKYMNIVVVPFENTDGGHLGYELQKQNPNWILHVARFNSCGRDFYHDYFSDSKFGESKGFTNIFFRWLPDFITDNHGVPSHEWAQPYSGYVSPWFKGFWLPRGIFYGICTHVDKPDTQALFHRIAEVTATYLNSDSEIVERNEELRERHTKYANQWMPNMYAQNYVNDLVYYFTPVKKDSNSKHAHIRFPEITSMEWITEVSDETSQGDYMDLCSKTHQLADIGVLEVLKSIELEIEEFVTKSDGELYIKKLRKRPLNIRV